MNMITEKYKWTSLFILSSAAFLTVLDIFIVNVAIPSIKTGISGSDGDIQLVIILYLIGYAAFLVTGAKAGERYGRKKIFLSAMVLFIVASSCCGCAQTALQMNIARFLQGISAAFMVPQSISYIHVLFPSAEEKTKAFGIYGSIAGTASVIGQFLGGLLPETDLFFDGWRLIFLINIPLGLLAVLLGIKYIRETAMERSQQADYKAVLYLCMVMIGFIFPIVRGRELNWPAWSFAMIAFSLFMLLVFIRDQQGKIARGESFLMNLKIFNSREFNIGLLIVLFYNMVQDSYFMINSIFFQTGYGISSAQTGVFFIAQGIGYVLSSVLAVRLQRIYGKKIVQAGMLIMVIALLCHLYFFTAEKPDSMVFLMMMFLYGMGCGAVLPALLSITVRHIVPELAGDASGIYTTVQQTAIALGIGISGGLFFYLLGSNPSIQQYVESYRVATGFNIVLLSLSGCLLIISGK